MTLASIVVVHILCVQQGVQGQAASSAVSVATLRKSHHDSKGSKKRIRDNMSIASVAVSMTRTAFGNRTSKVSEWDTSLTNSTKSTVMDL